MRENLPDFSHCLFDMLELDFLLPPFQLLGFIWRQKSLQLVPSRGRVSFSTTLKGSVRSVKHNLLTCMGIKQLCVTVEETKLQEMTGFEIKKSLLAHLRISHQWWKKKNFIPESQSSHGAIFVPTWKAGKPVASDVTVTFLLQSNSLTNAATKAGYALDAADERKNCLHDNNCAKSWITIVPLAIEVFGGISANFEKTLKLLAVLNDNRSFRTQGLSVAFRKLMQCLSNTAIRR